jgi:hypothetical protein
MAAVHRSGTAALLEKPPSGCMPSTHPGKLAQGFRKRPFPRLARWMLTRSQAPEMETLTTLCKTRAYELLAHPKEIFRPAISHSAYALVVVHNHPSGDVSPSEADTRLTRRIAEAAKILQIQLLDHVIVGQPLAGRQGYFSFKEAGVIS